MKSQSRNIALGAMVFIYLIGESAREPIPGIVSAVKPDDGSIGDITAFGPEGPQVLKDVKHCSKLNGSESQGWSWPGEYIQDEIYPQEETVADTFTAGNTDLGNPGIPDLKNPISENGSTSEDLTSRDAVKTPAPDHDLGNPGNSELPTSPMPASDTKSNFVGAWSGDNTKLDSRPESRSLNLTEKPNFEGATKM